MFKKASKSVCTTTVMISPEPLSPTLSISSATKTLQKTGENPDDSDPADKGDIQVEYSSDYLYSPSIGAVTKNDPKEHKSVSIVFDNLEYPIIQHLSSPVQVGLMEFNYYLVYYIVGQL
jgi:hypothetical protein